MRARRPVPRGQRGTSLAEFAICFTASMLLIMGIVDFGRAMYAYHLVSDIARILAAPSAAVFQDRGLHQLKGIDGQRRLYAYQPPRR